MGKRTAKSKRCDSELRTLASGLRMRRRFTKHNVRLKNENTRKIANALGLS